MRPNVFLTGIPSIWMSAVARKRVVDILGASGILLAGAPLLILIYAGLQAGGGRAIFRHERVGLNGRRFKVYKFRTMVPNAEDLLQEIIASDELRRLEWQADRKLKEDRRVTFIGRWLRKTSLDEIPQLFNVIKGDMSLVGPRPVTQEELKIYGRSSRYYSSVKPGMTGLWQVSGRNDITYSRRVAMDRLYVSKSNGCFDVVLLMKTFSVLFMQKGAY